MVRVASPCRFLCESDLSQTLLEKWVVLANASELTHQTLVSPIVLRWPCENAEMNLRGGIANRLKNDELTKPARPAPF